MKVNAIKWTTHPVYLVNETRYIFNEKSTDSTYKQLGHFDILKNCPLWFQYFCMKLVRYIEYFLSGPFY